MSRVAVLLASIVGVTTGLGIALAQEQRGQLPDGWTAESVVPQGYVRLDGARTFKLGLSTVDSKWYLFVAQGIAGRPGTGSISVLDVTEPAAMSMVTRFDVPHGNGQLTMHGDLLIAGQQPTPWAPPEVGGSIEYPFRGSTLERQELATFYDISNPVEPRKLAAWMTEGWATHRNGYPGGDLAFMSAWIPGYRGQSILAILNVSDPSKPIEVGRWWMPGQSERETENKPPSGYHGPPFLHDDGRTLTLGYTPALVNLDISDVESPKVIGRLDFSPLAPVGTQAIHTVAPVDSGHFLVTTEPSAPGCDKESLPFAAIVDNSDPKSPRLVAFLPRPVPPDAASIKSFCEKEGRFGPHNANTETHQAATMDPDGLIYLTYFNAGLRIFDASDPRQPREIGWFLPEIGPWKEHHRGLEDVIVDSRGNIYVSDGRAGGIWSLARCADDRSCVHRK
jgi:hypothetical protein